MIGEGRMNNIDFKPLMTDLIAELTMSVKAVIVAKAPTLNNSNLVNSIEFRPTPKGFEMWANDYYDFVNYGRKKGIRKVPITALVTWIRKKGFQGRNKKGRFISHNQLAFAIQTSIFKNGIRGKFFDDSVDALIDTATDAILDQRALDILTTELDQFFNE